MQGGHSWYALGPPSGCQPARGGGVSGRGHVLRSSASVPLWACQAGDKDLEMTFHKDAPLERSP